jgi:carbamoyl-phosphate synthase small subunit
MLGVLLLEDGYQQVGELFGAARTAVAEIVFNTSMSGYEEILTDPSYCGQAVAFTHPHIGNYGITLEDGESPRPWVEAVLVREESRVPSSWRSQRSLHEYLLAAGIPGLSGIGTRDLVLHLREHGAQRCAVAPLPADIDALRLQIFEHPVMTGLGLAERVSRQSRTHLPGPGPRVAVLDLGLKQNILTELARRGLDLHVFPAATPADEILACRPAGIVLSNGPGDPAALPHIVEQVRLLAHSGTPTFGICLGHQLVARAFGASTYKLKFGHRGGNHPVRNLATGAVEITSHNHGFSVSADALPSCLEVTHVDLYDGTLEGVRHRELPVRAVQYHPEAAPGPRDSLYLFDELLASLAERACDATA